MCVHDYRFARRLMFPGENVRRLGEPMAEHQMSHKTTRHTHCQVCTSRFCSGAGLKCDVVLYDDNFRRVRTSIQSVLGPGKS